MESKDNFEFPIDNSIPVTEWINFTTWTGKKICPLHTINKGGRTYETNLACCALRIYTEAEKSLAELLEESFSALSCPHPCDI